MLSSRKSCCSTIRSFATTVKVFGKLGIVSCAFNPSVSGRAGVAPRGLFQLGSDAPMPYNCLGG